MSVAVMSLVWGSTVKGSNRRHVLLAMANVADDDGICWPGYTWLAEQTDLSRRTVIRMVEDLQAEGWVVKDNSRYTREGDQDTNLYLINVEKLRANQRPRKSPSDQERAARLARMQQLRSHRSDGGDSVTPPRGGGSDTVTPPSAETSPGWCQADTTGSDTLTPNTVIHTSLTPKNPQTPAAQADGRASSSGRGREEGSAPASGSPASSLCEHGRKSCRACGTNPRTLAKEATAAEIAERERIGRACPMCRRDGVDSDGATVWVRIDPNDPQLRLVTPLTVCDHTTPHDEVVAQLRAKERAEEEARQRKQAEIAAAVPDVAGARERGYERAGYRPKTVPKPVPFRHRRRVAPETPTP